MKKGVTLFISAIALMVLSAWIMKQRNGIAAAEWLIGTWEYKTTKGSIYETWCIANHKAFCGKSYSLKEKDTIVFETIQLITEKERLFYIPIVINQNGGLPVRFAAKTISENQLIFENLQHDFPQTISYTRITADSLVAEIWGTKNGQESKQIFAMKRLQ